jgi:hypothetical protein
MLWALVAILGVPIWLVVGVLVGVVLSRRNFQRDDGVFAFNVRPERAPKWPRQVVYGRRVRDVLVTNRGAALVRTEFHAVDAVADLELDDPPRKPAESCRGRLGRRRAGGGAPRRVRRRCRRLSNRVPPTSTGTILAADDVVYLAEAMEPGSVAGVVVWENLWAAPFASAARRAGGQLVASGRIPIQAIVASLEADELTEGA